MDTIARSSGCLSFSGVVISERGRGHLVLIEKG